MGWKENETNLTEQLTHLSVISFDSLRKALDQGKKFSRHENFAVSRLRSEKSAHTNKMPPKILFLAQPQNENAAKQSFLTKMQN